MLKPFHGPQLSSRWKLSFFMWFTGTLIIWPLHIYLVTSLGSFHSPLNLHSTCANFLQSHEDVMHHLQILLFPSRSLFSPPLNDLLLALWEAFFEPPHAWVGGGCFCCVLSQPHNPIAWPKPARLSNYLFNCFPTPIMHSVKTEPISVLLSTNS